tara:strand:+ start:8237 stop:9178 length:942 start_codon:yes stop_codon:yes gene_type:complete
VKKNIISIIVGVLLVLLIFNFFVRDKLEIIFQVTIIQLTGSFILAIFLRQISGQSWRLLHYNMNKPVKTLDLFFFPHVQSLWSLLLPFQGSSIFTVLFLKKKHGITLNQSVAFTAFLFSISMFISGVLSLYYFINLNLFDLHYLIVPVALVLNPLLIIICNFFFKKFTPPKLLLFFPKLILQLLLFYKNRKLIIKSLKIEITSLFFNGLWLFYIAKILEINFTTLDCFFIAAITNMSLILKFTPGNLGTTQILTSGVMLSINKSPDEVILITLFASASAIFVNVLIGLTGNYHYFNTINIVRMFKKNIGNKIG